ncbi:MAG: hypothetical protein GXO79_11595 [Chlorobi bacterium]|nr:hypothetical protein [Chlorobiota bacterium]
MKRKNISKRTYNKPKLEKIKIDKNISMVMMSTPPGDPGTLFPGFKFPILK